MFDDRRCRLVKGARQTHRRVDVEQVVVGKFFSLNLLEGPAVRVERGRLLRILAVAKILKFAEIEAQSVARTQESGDRGVVCRGALEDRDGTAAAKFVRDLAA